MQNIEQINELTSALAQAAFPLLCKYSEQHDCPASVDISLGDMAKGNFEYYSASAVGQGKAIIQSRVSQVGGWTSVIGIAGTEKAVMVQPTIEEDDLTGMIDQVMEKLGMIRAE